MLACSAPIVSNQPVMEDTWLVWLDASPTARQARPGQFVMVHCGTGHNPLWRRPLSIHAVDRANGRLALLYAVVGEGTRWLSGRRPGEALDLLGPLGRGFALPIKAARLLLVGGGRGIAPLVFLAQESLDLGHRVTLLHGAPNAAGLYAPETLPAGVRLVQATEDGSRGERGRATLAMTRYLQGTDQIYACGPMDMYRSLSTMSLKVPVQVLVEAPMACGFGGCYGCAVRTRHGLRLACREGPCFPLHELVW